MPHNNPHQRVALLRPKSARETEQDRIAAECGAAWLAAKNGETHPRQFDYLERRREAETANKAWLSSFRPELPKIIVTSPPVRRDGYGDYLDRRRGFGGAELQE